LKTTQFARFLCSCRASQGNEGRGLRCLLPGGGAVIREQRQGGKLQGQPAKGRRVP
jgi:hypothetical protein